MNLTITSESGKYYNLAANHRPGLTYSLLVDDKKVRLGPDKTVRMSAKAMPVLRLKIPVTVNKRWWAEIRRYAAPMSGVHIIQFYDCTEVNLLNTDCVAVFRSYKHAKEFCQLNHLRAS